MNKRFPTGYPVGNFFGTQQNLVENFFEKKGKTPCIFLLDVIYYISNFDLLHKFDIAG